MTRSDAEPHSAVALFDDHAAGLHRYLARRVGEEAAAELLVETIVSPAAQHDRPRLFGIATGLLRERTEVHDPDDPLSVGLATLPAEQRDALLLAAWGRLDPAEIAVALAAPTDTVAALLHRAREALYTDGLGIIDGRGDGELAVLRSDIRSDAPTLAALRERVAAQPPAPVPTPGPDPAPPAARFRIRWQPVAGAVALLAVLLGALAAVRGQEPDAPQPCEYAAAPAAGPLAGAAAYSQWTASSGLMAEPVTELAQLPRATEPAAGPVTDLDVTMVDPPIRRDQYLYRRVEQAGYLQAGYITELWIPADVGAEWLMRQVGAGDRIEERATYGDFTTLLPYGAISVSDLSPDPRRNHTLLRVAAGVSPDPTTVALTIVRETLKYQPVPAGLRADLIAALGYVPDLQVSTEDGGRTAVISVDRSRSGQGRTDMLLDAATGMLLGDRYTDELGWYTTTVTTSVVDEIGVPPEPS